MFESLRRALIEALEDEYKARATYRLILDQFGAVRPFVNIVESEERHIQALLPLFQKYHIPIPVDDWVERVTLPPTLLAACQAGVQAEIENAAMYKRLLDLTVGYPDVQRVFLNLQHASQANHLTAFQRCVERQTMSDASPIRDRRSGHQRGYNRGHHRGCRQGA